MLSELVLYTSINLADLIEVYYCSIYHSGKVCFILMLLNVCVYIYIYV
jgi:hypothetical protein